MEEKDVKQEVQELLNYTFTDEGTEEQPIVVVGPQGSTPTTMLRVYAYGGRIGRVATRDSDYNQLAAKAYAEHLKKADMNYLQEMFRKYPKLEERPGENPGEKLSGELEKMLKLGTGNEKHELLCNPEYLDLILKAAKIRFLKKEGEKQERRIQTKIVKTYMSEKQNDGWCIVDMEFAMVEEKEEDKKKSKQFKPDIVVFDQEKGFGLVELKYENKSAKNLEKHYIDSWQALASGQKDAWAGELEKRCGFLVQYGLMNPELYEKCKGVKAMWYGFLFVGGKKAEAVQLTKNLAQEHPEARQDENCRFWHFPEDDLEHMDLRFDSAYTYEEFTK